MVMVLPFIDFVNGLTGLKVAAIQQAGLFKLRQHPVDRGQANIGTFFEQDPKNIFRGHVSLFTDLKNLKDFQPRQRCLQAGTL
jgi:hypothetical protein